MSVKFSLPCPDCSQTIEVGIPQAGQEVTCDGCGQSTTAPRLGELKKLPPADNDSSPASGAAVNRSKSSLFVAGILLAILGLAGGGGIYYYGSTLIVDFNVEKGLDRQDRELVDKLQPDELVAYFDALPIKDGLGEWKEQPHVSATKQGNILIQFAYVMFGIGAIGLVLIFLGIR